MKLTLASPEHAQKISEFYQSVHDDSFAHREMFSAPMVQKLLQDQELAVIIAIADRRIVGCGLGFPQAWNQSLEIGALSVDDVPDRGQIGKALFEGLRRLGLRQYGLAMFRARTEAAFKRGRNIGAVCWGYWPSPGVRSLAEADLIMGILNEEGDFPRCEPPDNVITRLPFARRVIDSYKQVEYGIPYPKNYPVGAPRGTGTPVISGRVWPTYHSAGNYITIESSAGPYPAEIIREFVGKVRQKGVSDVRLAMPVNQSEAFEDLLAFGFRPVSYLPGWFLRGAYRYDCVELIAGSSLPVGGPTFAERAIEKIDDGLRVI
jgi:hypothetical protein